ncbi:MAG: hypothetical protein KGM97_07935 [Alphaproteobacteria bacterium]|nr:hypothetical protein [Alphaproteobacteria bacterium]MDE2630904.1 hypothetical protein [Alphaproteobacteria bacterium]
MRVLASVILILCVSLTGAHAASSWRILKDHWSDADEEGFGRFVAAIGASDCSSSESCLRDPANPYRGSDQHFLDIDVDCAKWPYLLRAYYAWKNGLPFSYVDAVSGAGGDLRFTKTANRPVGRHDLVDRGSGIDGPRAIRDVIGTVFSGTYRTDAAEHRGVLSDFYSPAIQPGSVRPGSIVYDINGHVGIVYKIDADGRLYYMDAHPDYTITRSVYGAQFGQSPVRLGGGLKNWRPLKLIGAHRDSEGHLIGGRMTMAKNEQIPDYSLVQYLGTEPNPKQDVKKARYLYDGEEFAFYEYVRIAMSGGKMNFSPVYELKTTMKTLCNDLNDRAQYVDLDIKDGISVKPHPSRLPDNIYGSDDGEWETYSTPSRDARIKAAFVQFYKDLGEMIELWVHRDGRIVYDGYDLRKDLRQTYDKQSKACTITYLNSAKRPVPMNFDDMMHRLFAMSFDPYHCIELRWGASGDERESCPDSKSKRKWYEAEQRLRNQPDRTYDIQMGFDLDELNRHAKGSGIDQPPPVDIKSEIDDMPYQVPLEAMRPVGR